MKASPTHPKPANIWYINLTRQDPIFQKQAILLPLQIPSNKTSTLVGSEEHLTGGE